MPKYRIIQVDKTRCKQINIEAKQIIGHPHTELPGTNVFPISERITRQHINDTTKENYDFHCGNITERKRG